VIIPSYQQIKEELEDKAVITTGRDI